MYITPSPQFSEKKNNIPATVTQNSEMKMVAIISWKQDNMVHTIYWWL